MDETRSSRDLIPRHAAASVREALADTRVVVISGARQAGKSTLARLVLSGNPKARILTLDDERVLAAAKADPSGFVQHDGVTLIDEVQRAPELFLAIKAAVDRDNRPGQFLLTGSANALNVPRLAYALVGRMEIVELWPFSQGELAGRRESFIDEMFAGGKKIRLTSTLSKKDYLAGAVAGGFPEAITRSPRSRERWFESYLDTAVRRDVKDLGDIDRLVDLPRILRLLAARTASTLNLADLSRDAQVPASTLRRYLALLETIFLVQRIPGWATSRTTRVTRAPKIHLTDSGLAAHLLDLTAEGLASPAGNSGPILETFVAMELRRQMGWAENRVTLRHFRTKEAVEVDAVLETRDGRVAGIEVKAGATVRTDDFRGLRLLAEAAGERFVGGVVLYTGPDALPFGEKMWALPMSALWEAAA